jgi:AhpD family alkylhydroperoxidase
MAVAAEEQKLTDEQRELVGIGASVGAGCQPCVSYHLTAGVKAGVSAERLLGGVVDAELATAESAERLADHVRALLGSEVREPKATAPLDAALASLGGALGSNDLANVERQLIAAQQLGVSRSQLREAIELAHAVQESATRMHFRGALDLFERVTATGYPPEDADTQGGPASSATSEAAPNFVSMMAKFLALMDSCDSTDLREKMARCFSIFEPSCCRPTQAAGPEEQPGTTSTSANSTACDCSAMSFDRFGSPAGSGLGGSPDSKSASADRCGPSSC